MTLLYPSFLWLFIPLTILWYYRPKKLQDTGHLVILALLLLALARPVVEHSVQKGEIESRDIILALDASYSMRAQDIQPDRYRYAQETIDRLLQNNESDNIMLIAFTSNPLLLSPPTTDHALISVAMKSLNRDNILTRGTSLKKLFAKIAQLPIKEKIVVLFSDGGDRIDLPNVLHTVKKYGILPIVVAVGTASGTTIKKPNGSMMKDIEGNLVVTRINPQLEILAEESGGQYIEVSSSPASTASKIESAIEALSIESRTVSKMQYSYLELYQIPLFLALLLFLFLHTRASKYLLSLAALWGVTANASMLDDLALQQAYLSYQKGDFNATMHRLEKIDVPTLQSQVAKSAVYYREQRYKKALALYRSIRSTSPRIKQMLDYNIGNCYAKLEQYDEAIRFYTRALQLGEDNDSAHNLTLILFRKSKEKEKYHFSRPKPQGSGAQKQNAPQEEKRPEGKQQESSGGGSGGGGSTDRSKKKKREEKILLRPSKEKEREQPLGSKVYELINKGYVNEKSPW